MSRRRHCFCGGGSGLDFIFMLLFGLALLPFLGIYWACAGDTEGKRQVGVGIIIFCIIAWICSMFS